MQRESVTMSADRAVRPIEYWRRLAPALVVLALAATVIAARNRFDEMQALVRGPDVGPLLGAMVILALANVAGASMFAVMAGHRGQSTRLLGAFFLSQLAKYVPGRVWVVALQASILRCLSPAELFLANLRTVLLVGIAVAGSGLAFLAATKSISLAVIVLAASWWVCTRAAAERVTPRILDVARRVLGKESPTSSPVDRVADRSATMLLAVSIAAFIAFYCLGWWSMVNVALPGRDAIPIVAVLSLSYLIGIASMLPAGIGAREAAMVALAPLSGIEPPDMAMLAVVTRAGLIVVDAVLAVVGAVLLGPTSSWRKE